MNRISKEGFASLIMPAVKGVSLLLIVYYLYSKLSTSALDEFRLNADLLSHLPLLLLLCLVNWSIEALKWQVLTRSVSRITFFDSLRGVLSGLSLSMIVPIGLGDKIGRLGYIQTFKKLETISLGYLGGLIQFFVTLIFGLYGIFHLIQLGWSIQLWSFSTGLFGLVVLAVICLLLIKYSSGETVIHKFLNRILLSVNELQLEALAVFTGLSVLRYAVFASQLFILFNIMDLGLSNFTILAGVTWIFFSKTVIPAFNFLSDLGIREFSAILFFSFYDIPARDIILPTLLLWLINIFIPSLFGMYFFVKIRLYPQTQPI